MPGSESTTIQSENVAPTCACCSHHPRRGWRARWAAIGAAIAVVAGTGGVAYSGAANSQVSPSQTLVTPCRIMDTRPAPNNVGPRNTPIAGGETYSIQVTGVNGNCSIPAGTSGVVMNLTVVGPGANGFLTVFPGGTPKPTASNINYSAGQPPASDSGVTVGLGATGQVSFFASGGPVNVVADIVAYSTPARLTNSQLVQQRWDLDRSNPAAIPFGFGTNPSSILYDGERIWAPNSEKAGGRIARIDPAANTLNNTISIGGLPTDAATDGTNIWVTVGTSNSVKRVNAATGALVGSEITVGTNPSSVTYDGTNMWVTNQGSNSISKINSDGLLAPPVTVGSAPVDSLFDGTRIWTANSSSNSVSYINVASPGIATTVTAGVGTAPSALAFDGRNIWIANSSSNSVTRLEAASGAAVGSPITVSGASALAFDGTYMWVASSTTSTLTRIDTRTATAVGNSIALPSTPRDLAFDGANIWVAGTSAGLTGGQAIKIRAV